jgi:hypothetical protein
MHAFELTLEYCSNGVFQSKFLELCRSFRIPVARLACVHRFSAVRHPVQTVANMPRFRQNRSGIDTCGRQKFTIANTGTIYITAQ